MEIGSRGGDIRLKMEEIEELLAETYAAWKKDGVQPESEKELEAFEQRHGIRLPQEYRLLLAKFGAFRFAEPELHGLKEQEWAYPAAMELIAEYRNQGAIPPTAEFFPIGGFGDGDLLVLQTDGGVYRLYHDGYDESPLEPIAEDFASLVAELAEFAMDTYRAIHGK